MCFAQSVLMVGRVAPLTGWLLEERLEQKNLGPFKGTAGVGKVCLLLP